MRVRCNCKVSLRVARTPKAVCVSICGNHSLETDKEKNTKYLTLAQKGEIAKFVRAQPTSTTTDIRRQLQESSPTKKVKGLVRSVAKVVSDQKHIIFEEESGPLRLDSTFGSLHSFCNDRFLANLLKRSVFLLSFLSMFHLISLLPLQA